MILFTGRYSGLIEPEEHYIELKRDFSNVDAVLARLDDVEDLERLAERAYQRLVQSGEFGYRRFVNLIDETISRQAKERGVSLRPARGHLLPPELNADFTAPASVREWPAEAPRDPIIFRYKKMARENAALKGEIVRLNETYSAEISRLHEIYPAEISRLNEVYPAEIARLNAVICELTNAPAQQIADREENPAPGESAKIS
jgi:hypothetical protein